LPINVGPVLVCVFEFEPVFEFEFVWGQWFSVLGVLGVLGSRFSRCAKYHANRGRRPSTPIEHEHDSKTSTRTNTTAAGWLRLLAMQAGEPSEHGT
jgi:hypothetical protein